MTASVVFVGGISTPPPPPEDSSEPQSEDGIVSSLRRRFGDSVQIKQFPTVSGQQAGDVSIATRVPNLIDLATTLLHQLQDAKEERVCYRPIAVFTDSVNCFQGLQSPSVASETAIVFFGQDIGGFVIKQVGVPSVLSMIFFSRILTHQMQRLCS